MWGLKPGPAQVKVNIQCNISPPLAHARRPNQAHPPDHCLGSAGASSFSRCTIAAGLPVAPSSQSPITIRGSGHPTPLPHPGHSPGYGLLARRGAHRSSSNALPVPAAGTSGRGQGLNRSGQIQHLHGVNDSPFWYLVSPGS